MCSSGSSQAQRHFLTFIEVTTKGPAAQGVKTCVEHQGNGGDLTACTLRSWEQGMVAGNADVAKALKL